jgi:hypothetical protein
VSVRPKCLEAVCHLRKEDPNCDGSVWPVAEVSTAEPLTSHEENSSDVMRCGTGFASPGILDSIDNPEGRFAVEGRQPLVSNSNPLSWKGLPCL